MEYNKKVSTPGFEPGSCGPNQLDYAEEHVHKAPEAGFEPATFGRLVNNVTKRVRATGVEPVT